MLYNKSYLDQIFRSKENDSPSVTNEKIKSKSFKKEEDIKNNKTLSLREYDIEFTLDKYSNNISDIEDRVKEIGDILQTKLIELRENIVNCKLNVQEAILSEKKLIGETYTAIIPIDKDNSNTDTTTASIEDNIVLGSSFTTDKEGLIKIPLDSIYIKSEEDSDFTLTKNRLAFKTNYYNAYQQIGITLPIVNKTGLLTLKLDKVESISILDSNGYEIINKTITNIIKFPIETDTSFSIRVHSNKALTLDIKELYITEQIYNTKTVYETKTFNINENLTYLSIQTCDNYSNENVSFQYEISINGEDYRTFRPSNKLKNNYIPSIISVNKNNYGATVKLSEPFLDNGLYKFRTEDLVHSYTYNRGFSLKFGEDLISLEGYFEPNSDKFITDENGIPLIDQKKEYTNPSIMITETSTTPISLFSFSTKDIKIVLNNILEFEVDGELVNKKEKGDSYTIKKGIRNIVFNPTMWKEFIDLENYSIYGISDNMLTVIEKETGNRVITDIYYNPKEDINTSLYLQLYDKECDLYLKEEVLKKKYSENNVEYFYKEDNKPMYIIGEDLTINVNTLQIRVTMDSKDKKTCPFVSNITIRGI